MNHPAKTYLQLLFHYLQPQRGRVFMLALMLLTNIGLRLLGPQVMAAFINTVQRGGEMGILLRLALIFLGLAFVQQISAVAAAYFSENVGWAATNALRNDLVQHCLGLDLSFHNAHTPGEMIERVDGDVTALSNFFSQFVIKILGNGLLMLGILALLFLQDWRIGLSISLFVVLTLVVMLRSRNMAVPNFKAERQASAELFGFLEERISGAEDIRANGARAYAMQRFFHYTRQLFQKALKAALMYNILLNILWFMFALGTAAAFAVGANLYQHLVVTFGALYAIYQYTDMLNRPINDIVHQIGDLQQASAGIARVRELLSLTSKIASPDKLPGLAIEGQPGVLLGGLSVPSDLSRTGTWPLAVEFQQVTFGYHDRLPGPTGSQASPEQGTSAALVSTDAKEMVLQDISFYLPPGRVLGLLGRTGSGKTSLTRLLFRFYDPDRGSIRLGNNHSAGPTLADIRDLPLPWVRSQVGVVTQNIQLFQASVRDNLTFFNRSIPDERILEAMRELGLWGWYQSLPRGLDMCLGAGEAGLSAGEAQLLAFVRIFLKDPGLIILDEASSRLDPATERLIEKAVGRLLENRTAIIVAHRLETVQRAGDILILKNGRILEYGPRLDLLADPKSEFSHLMQTSMEEVLV